MNEPLRERPIANPARKHLEDLAAKLRHRDHTADITRDRAGRAVLKVGHPAVPPILTVTLRCGPTDAGLRFQWEWQEVLDIPPDDLDAVADRVASVLGVTA